MPPNLIEDISRHAAGAYGRVPNLIKETNEYTGMPGAVYVAADAALMNGVLTPPEQQVVLLTMARYHDSRYDAVIHARLALDAGVPPETVTRLLAGNRLRDRRLQGLVDATLRSCEERGWLDEDTLRTLKKSGVNRGDLYEIFAFIGLKTFTGFTEHISDPETDGPLKQLEESLPHVPEKPKRIERQRLFMG